MTHSPTPLATYRLQLHQGFDFDAAAAVAGYLHQLGVSHVYSSPYLQAMPGSTHGYDVVDHQRVNDELGGAEGHDRFCRALAEAGLGQVLDIVPNHMAIGSGNRMWWDVLENGEASRFATFFDIEWQPQEERLRDKVIVPVLADQYGRVLESGGIQLRHNGQRFRIEAAGQHFPVAPESLSRLLASAAAAAGSDALSFIAASLGRLPGVAANRIDKDRVDADRAAVLSRHRDKRVIYDLLSRLCAEESAVCEAIERAVAELNANMDALDEFLNQQNYRLAYWKTADQQLGYRRFFDVNSLVGLRMESEPVFQETHALVLKWLQAGVVNGLRLDHVDGLRDPLEYLRRLRAAAPQAWIVGEKILAHHEALRSGKRSAWPIEGTTGYDFLNSVLRLLVRPAGMGELSRIYGEWTSEPTDFAQLAHDKKLAVAQEALGSDVNRLTSIFVDICEQHRNQRDFTRADIRRALRELAACFPVYRTYVVPQQSEGSGAGAGTASAGPAITGAAITGEDRRILSRAARAAREQRPDIDPGLFEFLEQVLTLQWPGPLETEFVLRFQQFTSPVMAKGVEDTAFYCYNRLIALCEVGGDPASHGSSLEEFHTTQAKMQQNWPETMTTLSTHDTKRADDVRARLTVLSEMPHAFADAVVAWSAHTARYRGGSASTMPDRNTEYLLYQTLIGAWPLDAERAKAYMLKATREAKQQTSWVAHNEEFEAALNSFIDAALSDAEFIAQVEEFVARVLVPGRIHSLTQTLVKNTAPGVPDQYQGSELWDLSLVDPDNRRPVDFALRQQLLDQLQHSATAQLAEALQQPDEPGLPKLHVVHQSLRLRREHPEWFGRAAGYRPLLAVGSFASHVIAFQRGEHVLAVAQRHVHTRAGQWAETTLQLPPGVWTNRLTGAQLQGGAVAMEELLREFPVALLVKEQELVKEGENHASL